MKYYDSRTDAELGSELAAGAVGVLLTDTIYGIVASAHRPEAVKRLYEIRGRDASKACILLIANVDQLLGPPPPKIMSQLNKYWPGPVSIVLPAGPAAPPWVPQFEQTIAYRLPADAELVRLLERTGPLLAPSANPQGERPAYSIAEAEAYFGDAVDFYVDSGQVGEHIQPSKLIKIETDGTVVHLR